MLITHEKVIKAKSRYIMAKFRHIVIVSILSRAFKIVYLATKRGWIGD